MHGIKLAPPTLDFAQIMKRKAEVVDATTKGVAFLFKKNKIASFQGTGRIDKAGAVAVLGDDGAVKDTLAAKNILIASGSEVTPLPGVTVDEKKIVSSTGALELAEVPKRLVVVGAGIIGLELGLGVASARLRRDGDRVPRPHHAGRRRRDHQALPARRSPSRA